MKKISFICTIKNRYNYFVHTLRTLADAKDIELIEVVLVDYYSNDGNLLRLLKDHKLSYRYIKARPPFRRCRGLNIGADNARCNKIFFFDADIIFPSNIIKRSLKAIKPNMAYFPECRRLTKKADPSQSIDKQITIRGKKKILSEWRWHAYGQCGFMKKDFVRVGKWNMAFNKHGGADNELYKRWKMGGGKLIRERLPGLYHIHHPEALKNIYY